MTVDIVVPWESPEWDAYVSSHPRATVYHTGAWCSIVSEIGGYEPLCLAAVADGAVRGVLPILEVRSRLTGNRLGSLPFSDECGALAEDEDAANALVERARHLVAERGVSHFEMRGAPALRESAPPLAVDVEKAGFARSVHFYDYWIPLTEDTDAIRRTFSKKSVRQTINQSFKRGVTVRRGEGRADLDTFFDLYVLNRRRHGIPPQPRRFFELMFERLDGEPRARLYLAEFEGRSVASLIVFWYRGVAYAKYEGVDETARAALPVYPLIWTGIADAATAGMSRFDFGRTAIDNPGLNDFKRRWGTEQVEMPYFFYPPAEGLSVVKSDSLKYRLFTGAFRKLPTPVVTWMGARIFRHFG